MDIVVMVIIVAFAVLLLNIILRFAKNTDNKMKEGFNTYSTPPAKKQSVYEQFDSSGLLELKEGWNNYENFYIIYETDNSNKRSTRFTYILVEFNESGIVFLDCFSVIVCYYSRVDGYPSTCIVGDIEEFLSKVDVKKFKPSDSPKKTHWKYFLHLEMLEKQKREKECHDFIDLILNKQREFNDLRYQYNMMPSAPIKDVDSFTNFCKMVDEDEYTKYQDYEIHNYLLLKGARND